MTRILKTSRVFIPGGPLSHDRFYPLIRISGKWLEAHGFRESSPLYITETVDGLLVSPHPPQGVAVTPLETIKAEFKALGIETEQRVKPKFKEAAPCQPGLLEQVEQIQFNLPETPAFHQASDKLPDKIPPDQRKFFKLTRATKKEYEEY
jgi:hypothetical protein